MALKAAQLSPLTLTQGSCQTQECVNQQSKWTQAEIWRKEASACLFVYSDTHMLTHQQSAGDWTKQQQITAVAGMYVTGLDSFISQHLPCSVLCSMWMWQCFSVTLCTVIYVFFSLFILFIMVSRTANSCVVMDLITKNVQYEHFLWSAIKLQKVLQWIRRGLVHGKNESQRADHTAVGRAGPWQCGGACIMAQQRGWRPGGEARAFVSLFTPCCAGHSLACLHNPLGHLQLTRAQPSGICLLNLLLLLQSVSH